LALISYDVASGTIKTIPFKVVSVLDKLEPRDPPVKGKKFPLVDREKKLITIYSAREQKLVTFSVADEYLMLPEDTWKPGDDIRYNYTTPGQAIRMMNVSKTDTMKGSVQTPDTKPKRGRIAISQMPEGIPAAWLGGRQLPGLTPRSQTVVTTIMAADWQRTYAAQ
jgi:hypothetical protein